MKHFWIALLILAVCLAFCIWSAAYIRQTAAPALDALRLARVQAGRDDFEAALDAVEQAAALWQQHEAVYCTLLHHDETDGVKESFAVLREQAARAESDDFADTCAALITKLQHVRAMQQPNLANIF